MDDRVITMNLYIKTTFILLMTFTNISKNCYAKSIIGYTSMTQRAYFQSI